VIIVSVQENTQTDADESFTPASLVGESNNTQMA